ncbi:hypothetical protein GE09DRAFT_1006083 [Coniochaeta sp. 2T2.1]|nr:hypothetical protein GE09DRAFT_1006083 [Coniochaeta sp. 2T2.1]
MKNAFRPGDPVLVLAALGKDMPLIPTAPDTYWVQRQEQEQVNAIVAGLDVGHYHLFLGEKGTGKTILLLEAMRRVDGDGVSMFEAHGDIEIFRIRLGKALDYEFHEDYIGAYFSERGPRDTTALLDIERALNKLEKVALERRKEVGRPLVLVINQMHLIRDNDNGKDLFELLQQRAEHWATANLATIVFNSDEYWVYERLKQLSTRMEVHSITDLPKPEALAALNSYRQRYFKGALPHSVQEEIYDRVGGRLAFLNHVAKSPDVIAACDRIMEVEKTWFLNQCWILGKEMDDDVVDQQKWACAAIILATALVDEKETMKQTPSSDPEAGHILPSFPIHVAQQIITRSDYVREFNRLNFFSITSRAEVTPSSVPMYRAFKQIVAQPGFREHLHATVQRIADIESLKRTRELVLKDVVLNDSIRKGGT